MARLILEYRAGGNVTRLERDVKPDSRTLTWLEPSRDNLRAELALASAELLNAATPAEEN